MSLLLGLGLLVGATDASADPQNQGTQPQYETNTTGSVVGSDTMDAIAKAVLTGAGISTPDGDPTDGPGITQYNGIGSSAGERQMIGTALPGEPTCTAPDQGLTDDDNWGCQEVAPMSRQLSSDVCIHDTNDPRDPDDAAENNSTAEGLIVGLDGIAVITDNASHRQFIDSGSCLAGTVGNPWGPTSDNSAALPATNYANSGALKHTPGNLKDSAGSDILVSGVPLYTLGQNGVSVWRDVLRLIYTGCKNSDGLCALATAGNRMTRCSASSNPARAALVDHYNNIFDGTECTEKHCVELRQAYRRDDVSGTTKFMLDALGLRATGDSLKTRTRMAPVPPIGDTNGFSAIPEHIFCDGGDREGIWPAPYASHTLPVVAAVLAGEAIIGDPLQRDCAPEDDLCGPSGTIGLVRPIRSPREFGYPQVQCTKNAFARRPWLATSNVPTCPNGIKPNAFGCPAPYYLAADGSKDFDCLNAANSRWISDPSTLDGRVYNFIWRLSNGDLSGSNHVFANQAAMPEVAQWRQNMATLNPSILAAAGGPFGVAPVGSNQSYAADPAQPAFTKSYATTLGKVCQQVNATNVIGCVIGNTRCTLGFAGREAAHKTPSDDTQEVVRLPGLDGNSSVPSDSQVITGNYPLSHPLYINAIGGFENILVDCFARHSIGVTTEYCTDEVAFADQFYQMTALVQTAFTANGLIPVTNPGACAPGDAACAAMSNYWTHRCVGAQGATTTATTACGRVTVQPNSQCDPNGPSPAVPTAGLPNCSVNFSPSSGGNAVCG